MNSNAAHLEQEIPPVTPAKPLVSKRTARIINAKDSIEVTEDASMVLAPWFMAALSLPYKDPGSKLIAWERTNGNTRITISPYVKDGEARYPFGIYPRLLLTWMTTEAIKTGSSEIQIADGLRAFMRQLGISAGGRQKKIVLDQMQRLFNANIRIESTEEVIRNGEALTHVVTKNFQFTDEHELWLKGAIGEAEDVEWGSKLKLSPRFYESLTNHSFPVFAEAIKAIGNSAMGLDIYLFLVNRLYRLKSRTRISWAQLNAQFGGNYAQSRDFKAAFLRNLKSIQIIYPEARFEIEDKCLVLLPSKQHVPSRPVVEGIEAPDAS